jgi:hypothetical protein
MIIIAFGGGPPECLAITVWGINVSGLVVVEALLSHHFGIKLSLNSTVFFLANAIPAVFLAALEYELFGYCCRRFRARKTVPRPSEPPPEDGNWSRE